MRTDYFANIKPFQQKPSVASVTGVATSANPDKSRDAKEKSVLHQPLSEGVTSVAGPIATPVTPLHHAGVATKNSPKACNGGEFQDSLHVLHLLHQTNQEKEKKTELKNLLQRVGEHYKATQAEIEEFYQDTLEHHSLEVALMTFRNLAAECDELECLQRTGNLQEKLQ